MATTIGVPVNTNNTFATLKVVSTRPTLGLKDACVVIHGGVGVGEKIISMKEINSGNLYSRNNLKTVGDMYVGGNIYMPTTFVTTSEGISLKKSLVPDPTNDFNIDFSDLFNFTTEAPPPPSDEIPEPINEQNNTEENILLGSGLRSLGNNINELVHRELQYLDLPYPTLDFGSSTKRWGHVFSVNTDSLFTKSKINDFEEVIVHKNIHLGTNVQNKTIFTIAENYSDTASINGNFHITNFLNETLLYIGHDTNQTIINTDMEICDFVKINKDNKIVSIRGLTKFDDISIKNYLQITPQIVKCKNCIDVRSSILFLYPSCSDIITLHISEKYENVLLKIILKKHNSSCYISLNNDTYCELKQMNDNVELLYNKNNKFDYISGIKPTCLSIHQH